MVLSPNNGSEDRAELDRSLDGLVDLLLDLSSQEMATDQLIQPLDGTVVAPEFNQSNFSEEIFEPGDRPVLTPQIPDLESKNGSTTQNSPGDLKYIWYYLKSLEHKLKELQFQVEETDLTNLKNKEYLLQAILPFVDEAIRQRGVQDRVKMGAAIAQVLPTAIAHQIEQSPTSMAKALAPELGIAIQEQIQLDPAAISVSLGPQMGDAIKNQIVVERDAMVDALYPVIGNTISKYMVEMVQSINEKVESTFSLTGILRKLKAKLQGISEAELIFQESLGYKVQAILLIHKASGLVMREMQPEPDFRIDADMMGGMLTAIRTFVNECMAEPDLDSELHEIDYSASKILIEVAGYCYLAIIIKGEPPPAFIAKIRETLGKIVLESGKAIAEYDGDPIAIPKTVDLHFSSLLQAESPPQSGGKFPTALVLLGGAIAIALAVMGYKERVATQTEAKVAEALDGVPELSIYRITARVDSGVLNLSGRLPDEYLKQKAERVSRQVAPNWSIENQILTVNVPADPTRTAGEVKRVVWIYNQKKGVAIAAQQQFDSDLVNLTGAVSEVQDLEQLIQALKQIPGIASVMSTVRVRPLLESRLYFPVNSTQLDLENIAKLQAIRQFLDRNPEVRLKIIAHSDGIGEKNLNSQLSRNRANIVRQALINEGIEPKRLQAQASETPPPGAKQQPSWLNRTVRFEVFMP